MNNAVKITAFGIIAVVIISLLWRFSLNNISQVLSDVEEENSVLENQLSGLKENLAVLNNQISSINDDIEQVSNNLDVCISEIEKQESGRSYELHDPSHWEVMNFILNDPTSDETYDDENYNCLNYAKDVNNKAESLGIRCVFVYVDLWGSSDHACVGFNVTYKGMMYFEPQTDRYVHLKIGSDYWADCVTPPPGYYYPWSFGDEILDYYLFW